ncbi:hypothetical protein [Psychrobacter sp. DAB_AL43B]|uniref:hypothetical protein n=1 Tax=Psychrobacter sp. DAB_AL43B TaxID=1028416 RepID=UPI001D0CE640|nr:hypothetical protein [Psychrobacter sp. DAB_AL43B]
MVSSRESESLAKGVLDINTNTGVENNRHRKYLELNLALPPIVEFNINNQIVSIHAFNAADTQQNLNKQAVNIIASGPSIVDVDFTDLLATATIFINGSISLTAQHHFTNIVGYVISDARFILHQYDILEKYYTGQPLYATLAVLEALAIAHPQIIENHHHQIRIIYPVDRPWGVKANDSEFSRLLLKKDLQLQALNRKTPLSAFAQNPQFVIDSHHQPASIGLSLDMTHGFVEAGTVTYVATQLAYSRGAGAIHLYGLDLLNSNEPRFYEDKERSAPTVLNNVISNAIVPSFNLLAKTYQQLGVNIVNHSPISQSLFDFN